MSFSAKTRHLLLTFAVLTACVIQVARGVSLIVVVVAGITFLLAGNGMLYLLSWKERAERRRRKREYWAGALLFGTLCGGLMQARGQLLGEPPIPPRQDRSKKDKKHGTYVEWMWQYSPPPANGREHDLIQDPEFLPFLQQNLTAPQSFWGPNPADPQSPTHKTLADTVYDFLTIPGQVIADDNRYITVTGSVFHRRAERGLLFTDLNAKDPLIAFAAINWNAENKTTEQPGAEYTLWIFINKLLYAKPLAGSGEDSAHLPPPFLRSLRRWMTQPLPGDGVVQTIKAAILVDPDGVPHQVPVPGGSEAPAEERSLPKRPGTGF